MDDFAPLTVEVVTYDDGRRIVCTASGEIDARSGPQLDGEVRAALFTSAAETLVLDLSGVTFMDSSGLRLIIDLHSTMKNRSGRLVLRRPTATIGRLLDITNLTDSFDIEH